MGNTVTTLVNINWPLNTNMKRDERGKNKRKGSPLLLGIAAVWAMCTSLASGEYKETHILIRPFSANRRGIIGPGRVCPPGEFATGFKMRVQPYTRHGDNTALNAIRLVCSGGGEAISSEGSVGQWTDVLRCQNKGDYLAGVKIKTEEWRGWEEDDMGAINFEGYCSSGIRLLHRRMPNWVRNRGQWSEEKRCPPTAPAVCGIKARIDGEEMLEHQTPDMKGDKAGLTEVQLKCCKV